MSGAQDSEELAALQVAVSTAAPAPAAAPGVCPLLLVPVIALGLGVAASAVERLGAPEPGCAHLGELLELPRAAAPPEPAGGPHDSIERRTVALLAYGRRARFIVDGPISLARITTADLLPAARSLGRGRTKGLLGSARGEAQAVLLLDVAWLVKEAA